MKFRVLLKDPDTLGDAIDDAARDDTESLLLLDADERDEVRKMRAHKFSKLCTQWFEHGEYLTVEIDTVAQTCTVVPVKDCK